MSNAWEKTGRDGAHEDIAAKGPPCTTLGEARERCGAWLRGVEGADVDAAARGYLAAWEAHARDTSPRAGLDLDATMAAVDYLRPVAPETARHADDLAAEVRRLRTLRDDIADAFDDLVGQVWRATGETHEPPADVAALLDAVTSLRMAAVPAGYVAIPQELHDAACRLASDVPRLQREAVAARREGAEAMREAFGRALAAETARLRRSGSAAEPLADAVDEVVADARRALARSGGES